MPYAVSKDGKGWRAVNGLDDIGLDEEFSEIQPGPVIDLTATVRAQRVPLLDAADKAINKAEDNGLESSALRKYRQALRDITEQNGFPDTITWPVMPKTNAEAVG